MQLKLSLLGVVLVIAGFVVHAGGESTMTNRIGAGLYIGAAAAFFTSAILGFSGKRKSTSSTPGSATAERSPE